MEYLKYVADGLYGTFWSEKFWLPSDTKWSDLKNKTRFNTEHEIYPDSSDLYAVLPLSLIFLVVRMLVTKYVLTPIGGYYGLRPVRRLRVHEQNDRLNSFYKTKRKPNDNDFNDLSKELRWPRRKVERWFRLKRNSEKHCQLDKFTETGFLTLMYSCVLVYGIYLIHDEDFFHDFRIAYSATTWPLDTIKPEFRLYYIVAMSWAGSLLASIILLDVRRRDFLVQLIHHLATVSLFFLSWVVNSVIPGLLVLFINDLIHPFLNMSKMFMCLKMKRAATCSFIAFMTVWMYTRVYLHTSLVWTHLSAVNEFRLTRGVCGIMFFGSGLLVLLQAIHYLYTRIILQVAWNRVVRGQYGDVRSDTEAESDGGDDEDEILSSNGRVKLE